jgi:hypothetical protein
MFAKLGKKCFNEDFILSFKPDAKPFIVPYQAQKKCGIAYFFGKHGVVNNTVFGIEAVKIEGRHEIKHTLFYFASHTVHYMLSVACGKVFYFKEFVAVYGTFSRIIFS